MLLEKDANLFVIDIWEYYAKDKGGVSFGILPANSIGKPWFHDSQADNDTESIDLIWAHRISFIASKGRHGRDLMVVGFTTIDAISIHHH
jgi:hypothetical protein